MEQKFILRAAACFIRLLPGHMDKIGKFRVLKYRTAYFRETAIIERGAKWEIRKCR